MDIEIEDDTLLNIINEDNTVSDVFEYIKYNKELSTVNSDNQIIKNEVLTLDSLPITNINFHSLNNNDSESTLYSNIMSDNNSLYNNFSYNADDIHNMKIDDLNEWKKKKSTDKKLSTKDIDDYLDKRK